MGGGHKALLDVGGRSLLSRVAARLVPQVNGFAINANADPGLYAGHGAAVIADTVAGHPGPLAGVLAGLRWAERQGATHIASVACDTPFFPDDLVVRLAQRLGPDVQIALAATPGTDGSLNRHPTFGLWPVRLADDLEAALRGGLRKVVAWADPHGADMVAFPVGRFDPFFNVNTPADMEEAERIAAEHHL